MNNYKNVTLELFINKTMIAIESACFARQLSGNELAIPSSGEISKITVFCFEKNIPVVSAVKLIIFKATPPVWNRRYISTMVQGINGRQFLALDAELKEHVADREKNDIG